jgi:hypothetical protein
VSLAALHQADSVVTKRWEMNVAKTGKNFDSPKPQVLTKCLKNLAGTNRFRSCFCTSDIQVESLHSIFGAAMDCFERLWPAGRAANSLADVVGCLLEDQLVTNLWYKLCLMLTSFNTFNCTK